MFPVVKPNIEIRQIIFKISVLTPSVNQYRLLTGYDINTFYTGYVSEFKKFENNLLIN